jgi:hypothetical protein
MLKEQSISAILFLYSLVYPVKRINDDLVNLGVHRSLCMTTFILTLLLIVSHAVPGIAYTYITRHASPVFHSQPYFYLTRIVALLAVLFSSGLIRRGPKLHYSPLSLGTGFGINASGSTPAGGKAVKGKYQAGESDLEVQPKFDLTGAEQNVLDYANTSMLSFLFAGYVRDILFVAKRADSRWRVWRRGRPKWNSSSPLISLISKNTPGDRVWSSICILMAVGRAQMGASNFPPSRRRSPSGFSRRVSGGVEV